MRNAQVLGKPEEYFIKYLNKAPEDFRKIEFEKMLNRGRGSDDVRSVKIMANQAAKIDICLGGPGYVEDADRIFPAFSSALKGSVFVYIRRRDVVRQAISRIIARLTSISHATAKASDSHFAGKLMKGYDPHYTDKLKYSEAAISTALDSVKQGNALWQRFFDDWNVAPLVLTYEDVVDNFPSYLQTLAAVAGVTLDTASVPTRKMVKLANQTNDDWFARFTRSENDSQ